MLADVPKADVDITNPTHIAMALRYDRKTMQAPRLLAKGIRKNAEQIRNWPASMECPIVENKLLARLIVETWPGGPRNPHSTLRGRRRSPGLRLSHQSLPLLRRGIEFEDLKITIPSRQRRTLILHRYQDWQVTLWFRFIAQRILKGMV